MSTLKERTPLEELRYRVQQIQGTSDDWELVSLDDARLEALLVKREVYRPYHKVLSAEARKPKTRELWRRFWIDEQGRWHSKAVNGPDEGVARRARGSMQGG